MISDRFALVPNQIWSFLTSYYRELLSGVLGLSLGLFFAWQVWPVKWEGALPADILAEYKILIANGIAEDQQILRQETLNPGAEKILGYLSAEGPLPAVNETLALLRDNADLQMQFQEGEKELIEANLLSLQSLLIELPSAPDLDTVPAFPIPRETTAAVGPENQMTRVLSWFSILVLVGGCIWISYRMIRPRTAPAVETVRFNSDMEIEEYDEEEEAAEEVSGTFWSRLRLRRMSNEQEQESRNAAPYP